MKFYTEEGNWDLVGNNTPVFFLRDPLKFPDLNHAVKRDPRTNMRSPNNNWDFWTLLPEALHQVTITMSPRGIPYSYRHMHGFGSHTYSFFNAANERIWVKFHLRTLQGIKNLTDQEAEAIIAKDRESHQRDLYESIEKGDFPNCKITASNSLDEYLIRDLMMQGAQVDTFGVGERLITSKSNPVFGGVYKLAAIEDDEGNIIPKIKVSENTAKITNPHFKRLYRLYDRESGKAIADELTLRDEVIDPTKPHVIFDPNATWKTKELTDFTVRELQVPIFQNGELVYELPELNDIKAYCRQQIHTLWDEVKRFENPHTYYVDLSQKLWDVKRGLLEAAKC